jgi:histidinol dehydrogenase
MFAQAEHDEMAQSILLTTSSKLILDVNKKIDSMIKRSTKKRYYKKITQLKRALYKSENTVRYCGYSK